MGFFICTGIGWFFDLISLSPIDWAALGWTALISLALTVFFKIAFLFGFD